MSKEKDFHVESQFEFYLQKVKLDKDQISPIQYSETKRAFIAGCGQMLVLLRDEISALPEAQGIMVLEGMMRQVTDFYAMEINKHKDEE